MINFCNLFHNKSTSYLTLSLSPFFSKRFYPGGNSTGGCGNGQGKNPKLPSQKNTTPQITIPKEDLANNLPYSPHAINTALKYQNSSYEPSYVSQTQHPKPVPAPVPVPTQKKMPESIVNQHKTAIDTPQPVPSKLWLEKAKEEKAAGTLFITNHQDNVPTTAPSIPTPLSTSQPNTSPGLADVHENPITFFTSPPLILNTSDIFSKILKPSKGELAAKEQDLIDKLSAMGLYNIEKNKLTTKGNKMLLNSINANATEHRLMTPAEQALSDVVLQVALLNVDKYKDTIELLGVHTHVIVVSNTKVKGLYIAIALLTSEKDENTIILSNTQPFQDPQSSKSKLQMLRPINPFFVYENHLKSVESYSQDNEQINQQKIGLDYINKPDIYNKIIPECIKKISSLASKMLPIYNGYGITENNIKTVEHLVEKATEKEANKALKTFKQIKNQSSTDKAEEYVKEFAKTHPHAAEKLKKLIDEENKKYNN